MIPALEHETDRVWSFDDLRKALAKRGGQDGWNIVGFSENPAQGCYTLVFTRQAPASPNTGETREP